VVAIGVTGHRILTDLPRIEAGVDQALRRIDENFPDRPLTVISSLAEGADRLVVRHALTRPGARLVVPLPLPQSDYMTDFQSAQSKAEFLSLLDRADEVVAPRLARTRNEAYAAAGEYVLNNCDVLLAVWDGQPSQGEAGTGSMVTRARERGLPVAWVWTGNRRPGTQEPTTLGRDQGKVSFERF
jgi:hypothetical protein